MANGLASIEHVVVLMLENRSFDHMLGFLYTGAGNVSPSGQPFDGLRGTESNPGASGQPVTVFKIEPGTPNAYLMPGADPGEGYRPESAGINRPGEGDENALRRRSSEPRWPRAVRRPSARAAAKRRQGYTQAG